MLIPPIAHGQDVEATVPVLIAGGGPVGLALAHALRRFGAAFMLVERSEAASRFPKMDLTNARSMELFQRIGLAGLLRSHAVPAHHPFDVLYVTGVGPRARKLHAFSYPRVDEMAERIRHCTDGSLPSQPPMRISQAVLEPVLRDALPDTPRSVVRYGWALDRYTQDPGGVTAVLVHGRSGRTSRVRALWLVGCDGGSSTVRSVADIDMQGTRGLRPTYSVHFRSQAREVLQRWGIAWHQRAGHISLVAQNDRDVWTLQYRLAPGEPTPPDPWAHLRRLFGSDIATDVVVSNQWVANLLVADRFRDRRVFLAGDAAHQVIPTGGYGMNTGIADAIDLAWKLAAVLRGWGAQRLLEAYEAERRPVALRNMAQARLHTDTRAGIRELYRQAGDIEGDDAASADRRAALAAQLARIGNIENESFGIEHGYRYADSPVIAGEDGEPPPFDAVRYRPGTWPGSRLPNVALADGRALHDAIGDGLTLLRFGDAEGTSSAADAAAHLAIPFTQLDVPDPQLRGVFERALVLVRPDHHVAWRGDRAPADWASLLRLVSGRS